MTRSFDIVIVGASAGAIAAAIQSAERGHRVLLVVRSRAIRVRHRLRRSIRAAGLAARRISILTGARVECVCGIRAVEAVLLRRIDTNQCVDVNASALLNLDEKEK